MARLRLLPVLLGVLYALPLALPAALRAEVAELDAVPPSADPKGRVALGDAGAQQPVATQSSGMNGANDAFKDAQRMTDQVTADAHEDEPEFRSENADDKTDVDEITGSISTDDKQREVQDALKEWKEAWDMSEKPEDADETAFTADAKEYQKSKESYSKVLMDRRMRMSKQAADSAVRTATIHDRHVRMLDKQTAAAKASYLAALASNDKSEAAVLSYEEQDRLLAQSQERKSKKAVKAYKSVEGFGVKAAALAIEDVRQHEIASHSAVVTGKIRKSSPVKINPDTSVPKSGNKENVSVDIPAAATTPPTSVKRAIKEVATKNGLRVSVTSITGGKDTAATGDTDVSKKATAAVQKQTTQAAAEADGQEDANAQNEQIKAQEAETRKQLAQMGVKASLDASAAFTTTVKENPIEASSADTRSR